MNRQIFPVGTIHKVRQQFLGEEGVARCWHLMTWGGRGLKNDNVSNFWKSSIVFSWKFVFSKLRLSTKHQKSADGILSKLQGDDSSVTFIPRDHKLQIADWKEYLHLYISGETVVANCLQKKIDTLMQGINRLEKKIGCKNIWTWNWAKVPLECNLPPVANVRW